MTEVKQWSPAQVGHTRNVIRDTFIRLKSAALRSTYSPNPRVAGAEAWDKAAMNCLSLDAAPAEFVEAAFKGCRMTGGPNPNQLGGAAAKAWYRSFCPNKDADKSRVVLPPQIKSSPEGLEETVSVAEYCLRVEVETLIRFCAGVSGARLHEPTFNDVLIRLTSPGPETVKYLLGFPDPRFVRLYGASAQKSLSESPAMTAAARKHGMGEAIDTILKVKFGPEGLPVS